jgi:hypothetical protein
MDMMRRLETLQGFSLQAEDGEIGILKQIWFDDRNWVIRYLVVQTGNWLTGRKVLIAPGAVTGIDAINRRLAVELTCRQIKDSPPMESETTVSGHYEAELHRYYGWEPYWLADPMLAPGFPMDVMEADDNTPHQQPVEVHLRSSDEVSGYRIRARDGEIGHVEDFLIDAEVRAVRYLEVDTRNWLPGKRVLIAPAWVEGIDWAAHEVRVRLERDVIQGAPGYDHSRAVESDYESRLLAYYRGHAGR